MPSIRAFGLGFLWGSEWDPVALRFGAAPFLVGTLLTSVVALAISFPFSIALSLALGEHLPRTRVGFFLRTMVELLAGIPSVIYGFWGLFVVVPMVRQLELSLHVAPYGVGIFASACVLSIMIIPFSVSLGKEVVSLVPVELKEAALSLGATPFDVTWRVIIPFAKSGLFAGFMMAFGRALAETMAVTMVIGNQNSFPSSIFAPGNTLASAIANEFSEAVSNLYLSSLVELGLVLFVVTALINYVSRKVIHRMGVA